MSQERTRVDYLSLRAILAMRGDDNDSGEIDMLDKIYLELTGLRAELTQLRAENAEFESKIESVKALCEHDREDMGAEMIQKEILESLKEPKGLK